MTGSHYMHIAGIGVEISTDSELQGIALPSSYAPFYVDRLESDAEVKLYVTRGTGTNDNEIREAVATGLNDLGEARLYVTPRGYAVDLSPRPGAGFRTMELSRDFTTGTLSLAADDSYATFTVDSMLRILFSQAIVAHGSFILHASAVVHDGKAVLFMGKSGTGKSTHARLWLKEFDNTSLLNDDNPVVRLHNDGTVWAYGSPWSGKTPCYRQASAPIAAFVRLEQAPENKYTELGGIDAFVALLPGVSVITHSRELYGRACSTVVEAAMRARVGKLRCTPDAKAAVECSNGIYL